VTSSFSTVNSGYALNRATQKFVGTFTIANRGSAALSGPLQVEFDGLTAGVTLDNASGNHAGAPYIGIASSSLAPGASVALPLTFSNPAKAAIVYSAKIYAGSF
jgi:hypothetical protein